ncbi:uncharacterized protein Dana_GF22978, isoform B [Drosophila ananassae]|nr:uncharacterized protein Dana_GF22978, isoform B [Drosophila ananassae]
MESNDSSDSTGDSIKSIPRPDYEALSAIHSPQPQMLDDHMDIQTDSHLEPANMPSKRQKYVVSAPPRSANGSSNSSSSSPSNINVGSSLTMKLTKVSTSTPNNKSQPKVPKEMIALQRSHIESEVLTNFVIDGSKLKRRKSRYAPTNLVQQELSRSLNTSTSKNVEKSTKAALKRSKSIPAPNCDSDEDWCQEEAIGKVRKLGRIRGRSMAFDEGERLADLNAEDSNSMPADHQLNRLKSRSKTLSLSNSWSNDERTSRRSNMRSENEEFAKKHSAFLESIMNDNPESELALNTSGEVDADADSDWPSGELEAHNSLFSDVSESKTIASAPEKEQEEEAIQRLRVIWQEPPMAGWDPFCWKCRECGKLQPCSKCLRSFHSYCVRPATTKFDSAWKCPECQLIEAAPKRLRRNDVSTDLLSQLLSFALERMKHVRGAHKLRSPLEVFPQTYKKYFVNPVSFETLAEKIRNGAFQNTDEFLGEVKWIQHNALILDNGDAKVEQASKAVVKVCRQEANEIDTCPECYLNANSSDEWFVKVCRQPHLLLWAKLKGFPYWPAKAMGSTNPSLVNVRFFGKHDRAFVPVKDCFLYSAQNPNTQTSRRSARDLAECVHEVEVHIEHIKRKIGAFNYAPFRTAYDPMEEQQQLEQMMPGVFAAIDRELEPANKTPLQFLIRKTAGDKLSIVKKSKTTESGNESDPSSSPAKKALEAEVVPVAIAASSDHPKHKSSNYEVISRSGESLTDSRCKVLLKRKSLATKTSTTPAPMETPEPVSTKRKHSLSDASCTSESSDYKKKSKHARKQHDKEPDRELEEKTVSNKDILKLKEQLQKKETLNQEAKDATAASVVSVVELVQRRQGVTITKIPREQPQQVPAEESPVVATAPPPAPPPAPPTVPPPDPPAVLPPSPPAVPPPTPSPAPKPAVNSTVTKTKAQEKAEAQSEVERQQQQLIKKVIPFVEIKTEVMSEPEEEDTEAAARTHQNLTEQLAQQQAQEESLRRQQAVTAPPPEPPVAAPVRPAPTEPVRQTVPEAIKIKEEILSEDEMETDQQEPRPSFSQRSETIPMPQPMPPPAPLPSRSETVIQPIREESPATDELVRFVGDTTIQRINQKPSGKATDSTSKRRSAPQGPQTAQALGLTSSIVPITSPTSAPMPAASPSPSASPKPHGGHGSSKTVSVPPQMSPKVKSPAPHQYRPKGERTSNSTSPPSAAQATPASNLLRSNMVVIPVEQTANCNPNNTMTIPVPPLRAVSKSTLQNSQAPMPNLPGSSTTSMPPPLAGLSALPTGAGTTPTQTATSSSEQSGILANALNGLPSETVVGDSSLNDPITPGMATALSEMLLRSGPPKLVARPCGPLQSDGSQIYPSQAGPVSRKLKENAHKITDYFISVIEDTLCDMGSGEQSVLQARIAGLLLENERLKQHYDRQLTDIQRTHELMLSEMRKTIEQENKRTINELRQQSTLERMRAVEEAKKKQWCANCMREAQLYCCWNTSYCDYPCQQMHWVKHSSTCGQASNMQLNQPPHSAQMPVGMEPIRSKSKTPMATTSTAITSVTPNPSSQIIRNVSVPAAGPAMSGPGSKKWPPMMPMMNPSNQEAVLKLPSTTYLRPVVSNIGTTVTATPVVNNTNNSSMNAMMVSTPAPSNHMANLMPGQRNAISFPKHTPQTAPVQRFNIPLPMTVNPNPPFSLIPDPPHQKQSSKATGRSSGKNNNRMRQMNMGNNNPSPQGMRHNQMNQVFKQ